MKSYALHRLIGVSTESQEQQGESLNVQKSQIIDAVNNLAGEIPKHCWKYSGQERATPVFERKMFNQLLWPANEDLARLKPFSFPTFGPSLSFIGGRFSTQGNVQFI